MSRTNFRHSAFVYESDDEYVVRSVEFLRAGAEAGEGGLVAARHDRLELIREGFDRPPEGIAFLDTASSAARPARTLAARYTTLLDRLQRFPAMRLLTDVQYGPTADDWREWIGYEAALNRTLARLPVWAICAYDARRAPAPLLEALWETHPEVIAGGEPASNGYRDPREVVRGLAGEPSQLPDLRTVAAGAGPDDLRERLAPALAAEGVEGQKALGMLIAANEVAANARCHGEPPVELRVGRHAGRFVCEIEDRGTGFDDPLAGFDPPLERGRRAPGLWVVRQLVWKLEAFPTAAGFTVRLWL